MINTIIFDLDDTLTQTSAADRLYRERILRELALPVNEGLNVWEKLTWYFKLDNDVALLRIIQEDLRSDVKFSEERLKEVITQADQQFFQDLVVVGGVEEVLAKLQKENYKLAIHSNGDKDYQMKKLYVTGLGRFFSEEYILITTPGTQDAKPFPDGLTKLIQHIGVTPQSVMTVGDRITDVIASKLAHVGMAVQMTKIHSIEAIEPSEQNLSLEQPDASISELSEIFNLL